MIDIAGNVARVRARMAEAESRAGRELGSVKLMLAAKYQPVENLIAAIKAGERFFGHNMVQQLVTAEEGLADISHITTVIGHVQSNKISAAMRYAHRIDTVDSLKTAQHINRRQQARLELVDESAREAWGTVAGDGSAQLPKKAAPAEHHSYPILLQVNSSGAPTQFGCEPHALIDLAKQISELEYVRIDGLMTIGAHTSDEQDVIGSFEVTRELGARLQELPGCENARVLSMGMTHDLELAIEHGSTEIRIGTAIFGPRPSI